MNLTFRTRVMFIPLGLVILATTILVGTALFMQQNMLSNEISNLAESQQGIINKSIESLKARALTLASFAAETPGAKQAYALALSGKESEGRTLLRKNFDPIHQRITEVLGIKHFKVHFHLPPAKSFLRIWRKAGKKDGGDDISSFRKTVLKANQRKSPVSGIEIGRGGFAIRGVVPVFGDNGQHLGSVEALLNLNKLFETARSLDTDEVAVYMLTSELEIARKLKEKKPPQIGKLARIYSSNNKATDPFISSELLEKTGVGPANDIQQGRLLTAVPIHDFSGQYKGAIVFVRDASDRLSTVNFLKWATIIIGIILLAVLSLFLYLISSSIINTMTNSIDLLEKSGSSIHSASSEISSTSQALASGSSEQAASLEETSASIEEMASMTKGNAQNANQADSHMREANDLIVHAKTSMDDLTESMEEISKASEETSKIIKTIDEIAFQTNLLALNAAVEAARAGEAGAGFAVVADEVRNLAMRATEAARNTADLIEGTLKKVGDGSRLVSGTNEAFEEVTESVNKVGALVGEIAIASNEQAKGIDQINAAIMDLESVTQQNAAGAEQSAAASSEMYAQAGQLAKIVKTLVTLLSGEEDSTQSTFSSDYGAHNQEGRGKTALEYRP